MKTNKLMQNTIEQKKREKPIKNTLKLVKIDAENSSLNWVTMGVGKQEFGCKSTTSDFHENAKYDVGCER